MKRQILKRDNIIQHLLFGFVLVFVTGCYGTIHVKDEDTLSTSQMDQEKIQAGQTLYEKNCQDCHGIDAQGNGPLAHKFDPAPTDLLKSGWHVTRTGTESIIDFPHYSSEALRRRIRHGASEMPHFKETFSAWELEAIVYYIKYLQLQEPEI